MPVDFHRLQMLLIPATKGRKIVKNIAALSSRTHADYLHYLAPITGIISVEYNFEIDRDKNLFY